jgi:hypothetical protein
MNDQELMNNFSKAAGYILGVRGDAYPVELEYHLTGAEPLLQQQAFENSIRGE